MSELIEQTTVARLEREIEKLQVQRVQGRLFDEAERLDELDRSIEGKKQEIVRRRQHYEDIRDQLRAERRRILDHLLPARFRLAGDAHVFPIALEIRLPHAAT